MDKKQKQTPTSLSRKKVRRKLILVAMGLSLGVSTFVGLTQQSAADQGHPVRLPAVAEPTRLPPVAPLIPRTTYQTERFTRSIKSSLEEIEHAGVAPSKKIDQSALRATPHRRDAFDAAIQDVVSRAYLMPPQGLDSLPTQTETPYSPSIQSTEFDRGRFEIAIEAALASSSYDHEQQPIATSDDLNAAACRDCQSPDLFYNDFSPTPIPSAAMVHDGDREAWVYDSKRAVPVQHPWIEWGRIWYSDGITPRGKDWFGSKNLVRPQFYVYGDYRSGIAGGRNAAGRTDNWAQRLNLDFDLKMTDTERFHMFMGPLDQGGRFSRWELVDGDLNYESEIDLNPLTGFFEGDLGVILGTMQNKTSPMELPFTVGLVPLLFQNGIWMEDAVTGAAFSLPARHSRLLNWSNYDATFFAAVDQINSPAFGQDEHAAQMLGTAWFIEAYGGYIEAGYAFLRDRNNDNRSYHNMTASFTRRYFDRISNSVRVIVNTGQDLPNATRTADGALLLVENSWITSSPLTFVPYLNMFVGWDRPQSVARAGGSGGVLRNTGINFDSDGLNGLATLDTSASDTAGGAIGVDLIGDDLDRQWLLEAAYQTPHGSQNANVPKDQYALGSRYQFPISHRTLLRFDVMYGWRGGLQDVYGTRMEYRWKF